MDMTLVDVTGHSGVAADDQVTLMGQDGNISIAAEDIAEIAGTISYEISCGISDRAPRDTLKLSESRPWKSLRRGILVIAPLHATFHHPNSRFSQLREP